MCQQCVVYDVFDLEPASRGVWGGIFHLLLFLFLGNLCGRKNKKHALKKSTIFAMIVL